MVTCKIKTELTLKKDSRLLEIEMEIDNQARDHRIRVLFPTDLAKASAFAGSQYSIVKRDWNANEKGQSSRAHPTHKFVDINDTNQGLAVLNEGLHEYELYGDQRRTLALTLLRCTDWMSAVDPEYPLDTHIVPDAQCLGINEFKFAIYPHPGTTIEADVYQEAEKYLAGIKTRVTPLAREDWLNRRDWVQGTDIEGIYLRPDPNADLPELPRKHSFLDIDGEGVLISAIKKAENNDNIIVRMFNTTDDNSETSLKLNSDVESAWLVNLAEERQAKLESKGREINLEIEPYKIVTVEMEVEK